MNCLAGPVCTAEYIDAGSFNSQSMETLFGDASLLAPYVKIRVSGSAGIITVGNNSAPGTTYNSAAIKSFQYGRSTNGLGVHITIVDEEGGVFDNFVQKIVNRFDTANDKYELDCEWGWIKKDCSNGEYPLFKTQNLHRCVLLTVDIHMGSVITFELEGTDITETLFSGRIDKVYGSDDQPMKLKDAIKKIFQDNKPPVQNVQFLRKLCNGQIDVNEWEFQGGEPQGVWISAGDDAISATMRWIRPYMTTNKKGIIASARDDLDEPGVTFFEDYSSPCNAEEVCDPIASFIVNGGNCSNVLSFKTNIHWTFAALANTGGAVGTNTAENILQGDADVNSDCPDLDEENAGTRTTNIIGNSNADRNYGRAALKETIRADKAHDRATRKQFGYEPLEAELVILGNPNFDSYLYVGSRIGIVYINPIHLETSGTCSTWIATSNCNPVLSNKEWLVTGLSHEISDSGTYTTSFRLFLDASGANIAMDLPLGANPSGAELP